MPVTTSRNQEANENSYAQSFSNILENLYERTSATSTKVTVGALLFCIAYVAYDSGLDKKILDEILISYSPLIFGGGYGITVALEDLIYVMKELVKKFAIPPHDTHHLKLVGHGTRFLMGSTFFGTQCVVGYLFNTPPTRYFTAFSALFSLYAATDVLTKNCSDEADSRPQDDMQNNMHNV